MKILIVEDEKELSDSIVSYLKQENYLCEKAYTYAEAAEKVSLYEYDCILLDIMLPGGNGLDILRKVKKISPSTGVIIVSAKGALDDKVEGLKLGADDYLPKPFYLTELSMRLFALIRRRNFSSSNIIELGSLKIDLLAKNVSVGGNTLELTKTEYKLLLFLFENRKRVISKSALAEHLNGDMADMMDYFNFIYAHVKNLKAKLTEAGLPDCIKTVYGTGYKWNEE